MENRMMETIYKRMNISGKVTPSEVLLIVRDMVRRLTELEEKPSEKAASPKATGKREVSKVSKRDLSTT